MVCKGPSQATGMIVVLLQLLLNQRQYVFCRSMKRGWEPSLLPAMTYKSGQSMVAEFVKHIRTGCEGFEQKR